MTEKQSQTVKAIKLLTDVISGLYEDSFPKSTYLNITVTKDSISIINEYWEKDADAPINEWERKNDK